MKKSEQNELDLICEIYEITRSVLDKSSKSFTEPPGSPDARPWGLISILEHYRFAVQYARNNFISPNRPGWSEEADLHSNFSDYVWNLDWVVCYEGIPIYKGNLFLAIDLVKDDILEFNHQLNFEAENKYTTAYQCTKHGYYSFYGISIHLVLYETSSFRLNGLQ